jgi:hypothetical protein
MTMMKMKLHVVESQEVRVEELLPITTVKERRSNGSL